MSDQDAIQVCVAKYYQSLCTSDPEGVRSVFHPSARITGYLPDGLHEMTVEDFAGFVQSQQPSPAESGADIRCWKAALNGDTFSIQPCHPCLHMGD